MHNFIYSIFNIFYYMFDNLEFGRLSLSDDTGDYKKIPLNLFDNGSGNQLFIDVGESLAFNLAMLCTIITLILLLYMVYKICKLIICRIANL